MSTVTSEPIFLDSTGREMAALIGQQNALLESLIPAVNQQNAILGPADGAKLPEVPGAGTGGTLNEPVMLDSTGRAILEQMELRNLILSNINEAVRNHTHELGELNGILPLIKGGTGASTLTEAKVNLGIPEGFKEITEEEIGAIWESAGG